MGSHTVEVQARGGQGNRPLSTYRGALLHGRGRRRSQTVTNNLLLIGCYALPADYGRSALVPARRMPASRSASYAWAALRADGVVYAGQAWPGSAGSALPGTDAATRAAPAGA